MEFAILPIFPYTLGKRIVFFLTTRSVLWPKICRKCDSDWGSAPDPAARAHDAPPDPLVGWGADTPPHTPLHSAPLALDARAFGASIVVPPDTKSWRRHWSPSQRQWTGDAHRRLHMTSGPRKFWSDCNEVQHTCSVCATVTFSLKRQFDFLHFMNS